MTTAFANHGQVYDGFSGEGNAVGGSFGQACGCTFPANHEYSGDLHEDGLSVARVLASAGVLALFAGDFMSVRQADAWHTTDLEINLRKCGTTHPFSGWSFSPKASATPRQESIVPTTDSPVAITPPTTCRTRPLWASPSRI